MISLIISVDGSVAYTGYTRETIKLIPHQGYKRETTQTQPPESSIRQVRTLALRSEHTLFYHYVGILINDIILIIIVEKVSILRIM